MMLALTTASPIPRFILRLRHAVAVVALLATATSVSVAAPSLIPAPPQIAATAYLLIDADSGRVIVEHNADERMPPASLTKIMTSYIAAAEVAAGSVRLDDQVPISIKAWQMGGSKMFVREGTKVSFGDLLHGVVIQSGNDASIAVAEHIAGSEDAFVDAMNQYAAALGMTNTHFANATGWPAENHHSTAHDLALLTRALIRDYPEHYALYQQKYYEYNDINQPNRNKLLWMDDSVDGVKTGYTEEAGYCLISSAVRDNMRLIAVVLGADSNRARIRENQKLLTYGFRYYETHRLYAADEPIRSVEVFGGVSNSVRAGLASPLYVTIPRGQYDALEAVTEMHPPLEADIQAGDALGKLQITLDGALVASRSLVALDSVEAAGLTKQLWDRMRLLIRRLTG